MSNLLRLSDSINYQATLHSLIKITKYIIDTLTWMKKPKSGKKSVFWEPFSNLFEYVHNNIVSLNQSKLFAGLIIIILNISSKFVTIKLSKTMESYLKYTFSRDILIFAMAWMGTRDIYVALLITVVFTICMNYLFNEESVFCCLPKSFTEYHTTMSESFEPSIDEIAKAKKVLEQAHMTVIDDSANSSLPPKAPLAEKRTSKEVSPSNTPIPSTNM